MKTRIIIYNWREQVIRQSMAKWTTEEMRKTSAGNVKGYHERNLKKGWLGKTCLLNTGGGIIIPWMGIFLCFSLVLYIPTPCLTQQVTSSSILSTSGASFIHYSRLPFSMGAAYDTSFRSSFLPFFFFPFPFLFLFVFFSFHVLLSLRLVLHFLYRLLLRL